MNLNLMTEIPELDALLREAVKHEAPSKALLALMKKCVEKDHFNSAELVTMLGLGCHVVSNTAPISRNHMPKEVQQLEYAMNIIILAAALLGDYHGEYKR